MRPKAECNVGIRTLSHQASNVLCYISRYSCIPRFFLNLAWLRLGQIVYVLRSLSPPLRSIYFFCSWRFAKSYSPYFLMYSIRTVPGLRFISFTSLFTIGIAGLRQNRLDRTSEPCSHTPWIEVDTERIIRSQSQAHMTNRTLCNA